LHNVFNNCSVLWDKGKDCLLLLELSGVAFGPWCLSWAQCDYTLTPIHVYGIMSYTMQTYACRDKSGPTGDTNLGVPCNQCPWVLRMSSHVTPSGVSRIAAINWEFKSPPWQYHGHGPIVLHSDQNPVCYQTLHLPFWEITHAGLLVSRPNSTAWKCAHLDHKTILQVHDLAFILFIVDSHLPNGRWISM